MTTQAECPTLYLRLRTTSVQQEQIFFLEFFLHYEPFHNTLCLPIKNLVENRFKDRTVGNPFMLYLNSLGPDFAIESLDQLQLESPLTICAVCTSSVQTRLVQYSYETILSNGIWTSFCDLVPKGGPMGPSKAAIFGIAIQADLHRILWPLKQEIYTKCAMVYNQPKLCFTKDPRVVYHGTAKEFLEPIVEQGFKPTFGMLGTAIYFSHFWKAHRFASMTQDYKPRRGIVVKVYSFWSSTHFISVPRKPCECSDCSVKKGGLLSDHNQVWALLGDSVHVWPCTGFGCIKNEEFACLDNSKLLIDSFGLCLSSLGPHDVYDPFNRLVCII